MSVPMLSRSAQTALASVSHARADLLDALQRAQESVAARPIAASLAPLIYNANQYKQDVITWIREHRNNNTQTNYASAQP